MAENDKMWHEEHGEDTPQSQMQGSDLRNVGVTPGAINTDFETLSDIEAGNQQGIVGGGPPPEAGGEIGAGGIPSPTGGAGGAAAGGQTAGATLAGG